MAFSPGPSYQVQRPKRPPNPGCCNKSPARRIASRRIPPKAFTLIELLVVIAIISLLISILVPALGRAREISRRTLCGSNMRQFGTALLNYSQDFDSWLPAKGVPNDPDAPVSELAQVQQRSSTSAGFGPNFAGMVRDIMERKVTREQALEDRSATPTYITDPKMMLCSSDLFNNPPGNIPNSSAPLPPHLLWPTQAVSKLDELPRTTTIEQSARKSYSSFIYIALWRNDDRGDFLLMSDQSNHNDTTTFSFTYLEPEDNHGTRGVNVLLLDSHVEWSPARSGNYQDLQHLSNRYWGPIIAARPRYPGTAGTSRSAEVQTIE